MRRRIILISIIGILFCGISQYVAPVSLYADDYVRATEDPDNVKNKIYPRSRKIEFGADFGAFLNQGFVNTMLLHFVATYFFSENWGGSVEYSIGMVSDKDERACIETFYNANPDSKLVQSGAVCKATDPNPEDFETDGNNSNYGPAYMPIREVTGLAALNLVWTPVYGKQLIFMSNTSFFDIFFTAGLGAAMSTFYPDSETLKDGKTTSRCSATENEQGGGYTFDCGTRNEDYIGKAGRPDPESSTLPIVNLGIGQKFHFGKRFSVKVELRNTTILGTPSAFENLVAVWGGLNLRI